MSKTSPSNEPSSATASASAEQAPAASMTLTEFCVRLSETVRRPELIGAFESVEKAAGRNRATEAEFRARFDAFRKQPI